LAHSNNLAHLKNINEKCELENRVKIRKIKKELKRGAKFVTSKTNNLKKI
jgi:hypothetical protein